MAVTDVQGLITLDNVKLDASGKFAVLVEGPLAKRATWTPSSTTSTAASCCYPRRWSP